MRSWDVSRIDKMRPGSWVFFSGDKRVYFGGTIALMWRNKELATRLWGTDHAGSTWEYMYALSGTRGFDITVAEIRTLLGWNPNRNIMRISVLSEEESETLQSLLTLDSATAALEPVDLGACPSNQPRACHRATALLARNTMSYIRQRWRLARERVSDGSCS
ncbi:hypothetical protein AB0G81_27570 [Streptomyces asoensis]|uniref:hypothetical protein n=1 Tax=Streptomyces asoensis TaxID=249586 RepID=UPI003407D0D8